MALATDNTKGRSTAFGTYSDLRCSLTAALTRVVLFGLRVLRPEHVAQRLAFLHYAHWIVIGRRDMQRLLSPRGGKADAPYLFFLSEFSGDWEHYLTAFSVVLHRAINFAWWASRGWPGATRTAKYLDYITAHELETQAYHQAYAEADAVEVRGALHVSEELERFFVDAERLDDDDSLRGAYERLLIGLRGDLSS